MLGRAALVVTTTLAACAHPSTLAPAASPLGAAPRTVTSSASALGGGAAGRLSRAALLRSAPVGSYLIDVLAVQHFEVVRWPDRVRQPINVYIADGSKLPGWRPTFPDVVRSAFTEWCELGVPLRVAFVSDSTKAQVKVRWVESFGDDVSGRTSWQYDDAGIIHAGRTTLSTLRGDGRRRTDAQLRAIALHEFGHALGLQHAQNDPTSIMAPRVDVLELSAADKATVRLLYSLPPGVLQ
jgi:predicted Zn-dependent protease